MTVDSKQVLIQFETAEQAKAFVTWMSESGEQQYFDDFTLTNREHQMVSTFDYQNNVITGTNE